MENKRLKKYPEFDGTQNCAQIGTEAFYIDKESLEGFDKHERNYIYNMSRKACTGCPFLDECFTWGMYHEKYGIWGGTTEKMRYDLRKKMNITLIDPYHLATGRR